ncbi:hypothetical protein H2200_010701 [Cladophialophora chaetospira]|uniref:Psi-producing oxygenase A n=1 Tax=Cladophialophora chaetospira TaxID=386627 RepID=A0AA38X0N8_9EURO|nr:hypothetical protein H2200_010701 [Cladophialophora chaetospira]
MSEPWMNGTASLNGQAGPTGNVQDELLQLNLEMKNLNYNNKYAKYHGDKLIGDKVAPKGFIANLENSLDDFRRILRPENFPAIGKVLIRALGGHGLDMKAGAPLVGALSNDSNRRRKLLDDGVKTKYNKMLHPPLTYLGDAFQYRQADGKFNNVLIPHLGQAGAPYAKTVPSKTRPLGALPDPGDLFDRLMARQDGGRNSQSGLSAMLIYHATIIIHDIFRTNDKDKNISDSSSYLDLSPLYGYTPEMQRKVRDGKYKLGLLKPDTFAEDRLLRQPPGVCIYLVMYNRYHNYAATQLRRINENGRFSVPDKYQGTKTEALARRYSKNAESKQFIDDCKEYNRAWKAYQAREPPIDADKRKLAQELQHIAQDKSLNTEQKKHKREETIEKRKAEALADFEHSDEYTEFRRCEQKMEGHISQDNLKARYREKIKDDRNVFEKDRRDFEAGYDAAWDKLDDDLFNTARLITCGMYVQISVHDYLRALMGFHQYNTNFTLDPRMDIDHKSVSRGIGNQVTVEFNLLYRFHCAITQKDEAYTETFMKTKMDMPEPKNLPLDQFISKMAAAAGYAQEKPEPCEITFGLTHDDQLRPDDTHNFQRNSFTGLFDDQQMINALTSAMDDPISNFGPRNIPQCLKPVEIMGIMQARKWEVGTLNDFRDFFNMPRHESFESVTGNVEIQNALRDLYEHPDKIELYPGIFCESDEDMGMDPGPSDVDSALWAAIFSDAITLVRSDRFYTVDWNTNSLTSWGMKEVTEDNDICKSSVFHRLLQRAFPGWFPYDSVRFFHPFYTSQQNALFAEQQGYASDFRFKPAAKDRVSEKPLFNVAESTPRKPRKPVYLCDVSKISEILADRTGAFVHPALNDMKNFPNEIQEAFGSGNAGHMLPHAPNPADRIHEDTAAIKAYLTDLMRYIVKRESIVMNNTTFQLDATRDFAIPVTTRYVADFLGFGHLVIGEKYPNAPHSENEIYQHITNCHVFLSYNADETKLMKRRKAFKSSIKFLYDLTLYGNISEASKWKVSQAFFGRKRDNPMTELGFEVAQHVLKHERSPYRAAAILVFVGLHTAYNSVLAFTSVLHTFIKEMYDHANSSNPPSQDAKWMKVQELALRDDAESSKKLSKIVAEAELTSIRLPIIRTALKDHTFDGFSVTEGDTVILDLYRANVEAFEAARLEGRPSNDSSFVNHTASITEQFADYNPKKLASMSVTAMIKTIAQMKNARRGHDAQGRLKKVDIDASDEGYSNFMAPMRMQRVSRQVDLTEENTDYVYTKDTLRPATDTYLTAEWDEFVPFPNTWKIRFDGFGKSNYSKDGERFGALKLPKINEDALAAPPFYQPQGVSQYGGSFADIACVCNTPGKECHCKDAVKEKEAGKDGSAPAPKKQLQVEREMALSTGCGVGK